MARSGDQEHGKGPQTASASPVRSLQTLNRSLRHVRVVSSPVGLCMKVLTIQQTNSNNAITFRAVRAALAPNEVQGLRILPKCIDTVKHSRHTFTFPFASPPPPTPQSADLLLQHDRAALWPHTHNWGQQRSNILQD